MHLADIYTLYTQHPNIATDSRKVSPGSLFFALKGENFDANHFAVQALEAGAAFAVVDNAATVKSDRYILVEDVLETLQQLALHHRNQFNIPVLAITGSNGKTTTKELIAAVLKRKFNCLYTEGNLNNHIGVPLTLLRINNSHRIAVIEMGANHIGEIASLCRIARPTYGLITNIGKAHLEGFGSYEGVVKAKTELYEFIRADLGKVFLNSGDQLLSDSSNGISNVTYSINEYADYAGVVIEQHPFLKINCSENCITYIIPTNLTGLYNAVNVIAAACVGRYFGVAIHDVISAIEDYIPGNNRSQILNTGRNQVILDAYNANPTSMAAALDNFREFPASNKICVLGDMMELGSYTDDEHREIIRKALNAGFNKCIFIGSIFFRNRKETQEAVYFDSTDKAYGWLKDQSFKGFTILIKGSRKMQLETLTQAF